MVGKMYLVVYCRWKKSRHKGVNISKYTHLGYRQSISWKTVEPDIPDLPQLFGSFLIGDVIPSHLKSSDLIEALFTARVLLVQHDAEL